MLLFDAGLLHVLLQYSRPAQPNQSYVPWLQISNRTYQSLVLQDHEVFQRVCPAKHRTPNEGLLPLHLLLL